MARLISSTRQRGTKLLGGDAQEPPRSGRPWWLGGAIAGAGIAVLLILLLVVNLVGGDEANDAGGSSSADEGGVVVDEIGRGVGGDPRTVERELVNGVPDKVLIGSDFPQPAVDAESGGLTLPPPEELRLAYVTVTRAKQQLDVGSLGWVRPLHDQPGTAPVATRQPVPAVPEPAAPRPAASPEPVRYPTTSITLSTGDGGELLITVAPPGTEQRPRPAVGLAPADLPGLALPLTTDVPVLIRPPAAGESLLSDEEVAAWLGAHLPTGPLATAWNRETARTALTEAARDSLRDAMAQPAEDIVTWLVENAAEIDELTPLAHSSQLADFATRFAAIADDLINDGGSEPLLWAYHGVPGQRDVILQLAAASRRDRGPARWRGARLRPIRLRTLADPRHQPPNRGPHPRARIRQAATLHHRRTLRQPGRAPARARPTCRGVRHHPGGEPASPDAPPARRQVEGRRPEDDHRHGNTRLSRATPRALDGRAVHRRPSRLGRGQGSRPPRRLRAKRLGHRSQGDRRRDGGTSEGQPEKKRWANKNTGALRTRDASP